MSKAILVIDTPKNCDECPFINGIWCMPIKTEIENPFDEIMKECPLKQMPHKLDANDWRRAFSGTYEIREAKGEGYNFCIDEILGEEE